MKRTCIYELAIVPTGSLNTIRERETHCAYFSNLKKTVECLVSVLTVNGWPVTINYSAVYRSLQSRGRYTRDFDIGGNKVFKVIISSKVLNPVLTTLNVEEMPFLMSTK